MPFFYKHNHHHQVKGFTLLETLVSIGILAMVIIGPLAVIINSSSYARQTKDTITATYLAEESIELLQNQYDSLYVFCKKQSGIDPCIPIGEETPGQTAWRVFKDRLATSPSCFLKHGDGSADNPYGCSFDFIHMIGDITVPPVKYLATGNECKSIIEIASTTQVGINHTYVCKGLMDHYFGGETSAKEFTRNITVEWLPTFEVGNVIADQYNDDLRIVVRVTYRGFNGYPYTVSITQYMHSQP
jgi:type II secretory pathway pseudopilin PulG